MECTKCLQLCEMVPKRKICRPCYNNEKKNQRNNRYTEDRNDECTKCFEVKMIPKGRKWCKDCKNNYEKNRKNYLSEDKKRN